MLNVILRPTMRRVGESILIHLLSTDPVFRVQVGHRLDSEVAPLRICVRSLGLVCLRGSGVYPRHLLVPFRARCSS